MDPNATCLVLGLGSSGEAAARLLRAEGRAVTVLDRAGGPERERAAAELRALGIEVELEAGEIPGRPFGLCVASPGVAAASAWIRELARRGVPVIPELELGWSRRACRVAAVTGSNGKSTAVKWLAESLAAGGARVAVGGNYGPPVCAVVAEARPLDWLVLEVSSFQLETARAFRADVGVLLNVQPNHLDRHGGFEAYERCKAQLFARARAEDAAIVPAAGAARLRALAGEPPARWITFGAEGTADYAFEGGAVWRGGAEAASVRGTYFDNDVLGRAAAAVVAAVEACGFDAECAAGAARAFEPLPHRMQTVEERDGVRWINDSKATSMTAMLAGLRMLGPGRRVRLIAGGRPKETDFTPAKEMLAFSAAKIYLLGESADTMRDAWEPVVPCEICGTLENAVRSARREAVAGDTVLFSPACTSFDQFRNFEDRGNIFVRWVRESRGGREPVAQS